MGKANAKKKAMRSKLSELSSLNKKLKKAKSDDQKSDIQNKINHIKSRL
tara:strand:- start:424 stop:570 length:147 start_codon:yes stop_codon:yes gene_type:complete